MLLLQLTSEGTEANLLRGGKVLHYFSLQKGMEAVPLGTALLPQLIVFIPPSKPSLCKPESFSHDSAKVSVCQSAINETSQATS